MKKYIVIFLAVAGLALAGCSQKSSVERTSQKFNSLPRAVQHTVRAQAPDAEIASVDKKSRNGMQYYVIEFKEPGRNPKITIAENGTLVTTDGERAMGSASPDSGTISGRWTERKGT